ncbi:hypothetical protein [Mesorhizobium sp. CA7]|uniref:hypothetical protein n=1 Tax=Mesorhizobium sp. CA7 TaxID=588501 RepID=UPI001CCD3500|nr:hypothetical protein [Mesorhizobium sp. CA7]MBZ9812473.1 hypothetical protein [Mesorhizobium sp. CA7]
MGQISEAHYAKMKTKFRLDVARFLAEVATGKGTITYGELSRRFGVATRGWGDILGGIAIWCYEAGHPLLPVIVVKASTRMPSEAAVLYSDLGLRSNALILQEQQKCFLADWGATSIRPAF